MPFLSRQPPGFAPFAPAPDALPRQILKWLNGNARAAVVSHDPSPSPSARQHLPRRRATSLFWSSLGVGADKGPLGGLRWGGFGAGGGAAGAGRRCSRFALEMACEEGHLSTAVWLTAERPAEVRGFPYVCCCCCSLILLSGDPLVLVRCGGVLVVLVVCASIVAVIVGGRGGGTKMVIL